MACQKEILKRNQFGGTLGGPAIKDKLFWFVSYGGQRQSKTQTTTELPVFTPAELTGDFSKSGPGGTPDLTVACFLAGSAPLPVGACGYDDDAHTIPHVAAAHPFYQSNALLAAQGIIDPTNINPTAKKYIAAGLVPTSPSGGKIAQASSTDINDQVTAKVDYVIGAKDKLMATLGWGRAPVLNPFSFAFGSTPADAFGYGSTGDHRRRFANIAWDHTFSPTLLNEARFTAQRVAIAQAIPASKLPTAADLGIGTTPDESTGPPIIGFYRGLTLGFSPQGPTSEVNNTYALSDTLTWVKGKHTLKFGFLFSPYQNNTHYDFYVNGEFDFYGSTGCIAGSCNDFADFLFGLPDEYYQFGAAPSNIRSRSYHAFGQDEWHIAKNLVLSLGLRYEYNEPKYDTQGRSFSIWPGHQSTRFANAPLGLTFPGDAGAPRGANLPDRNNFAPRFGFAWDPWNNGKTSVRGGIGVFYDILKGEDNLQFNGQAPFFGYTDFNFPALAGNPTSDPGYFSQPFAVAGVVNPFPSKPPAANIDFGAAGFLPAGGGGVYFVDRNLRTPYTYQYNLSIQHELAPRLALELSYVGSITRKQTALADANPFILGTNNRIVNTLPGVAPDSFSYLLTFGNVVNANYNSLQASLTKQLSTNRTIGTSYFTLAYTWSKSIDNASGFRNVNSEVPAYNHGQFRSVSDYDIPHRLVFSGGWDLPLDHWGGPKRLVQGWSLYPIFSWRSGFPIDIFSGFPTRRTDPSPSGAGDGVIVRPDLSGTGVPTFDAHNVQTFTPGGTGVAARGNFWFNPEVLNTNYPAGAFTYGTLPRNFFRGPTRGNLDLSLAKKTAIVGERLNIELRADFFNILNHTEFQMPTLTYADPAFGQVTSTYDPRIIQLAVKLTF